MGSSLLGTPSNASPLKLSELLRANIASDPSHSCSHSENMADIEFALA
jgi:hypothetical protein